MDDIVDQTHYKVLGNALQRISGLERIGQHQLHTDPPRIKQMLRMLFSNRINVSLVFGDKVRLSNRLHQQAHHVDLFRLQEEHRVAQHLQRHLQLEAL